MWSDKETNIDYLNFGYLVNLITDIAMDRSLTPSTIGLYGDWGSGKSSLMKLAKKSIEEKSEKKKRKMKRPKRSALSLMDGCLKVTRILRLRFVAQYSINWQMYYCVSV